MDVSAGPRTEQDCAEKRYWQDRSEAGMPERRGVAKRCGLGRLARDGVVRDRSADDTKPQEIHE
jgi:hypothetical protein